MQPQPHYRRIECHDWLLAHEIASAGFADDVRDWFWVRVGMADITSRLAADAEWLRGLATRVKSRADTEADRTALVSALVNGRLLWRRR